MQLSHMIITYVDIYQRKRRESNFIPAVFIEKKSGNQKVDATVKS